MDTHTRTRISLHGVAEGLLAGPQYERSGTIRLRVLQGGFATVAEPMLRVSGDQVVSVDGRRVPLAGTFAQVASELGERFTRPDMYADHAPVGEGDPIEVDPAAAARIAAWFERGRQALTAVARTEAPVLWPEHFDLAVTVDEVNLGVSPGDAHSPEPYAYVGPWDFDADAEPYVDSPFWAAPFGATLRIDAAPDADALARFFSAGMTYVAQHRREHGDAGDR
jgi:hypothetical protein